MQNSSNNALNEAKKLKQALLVICYSSSEFNVSPKRVLTEKRESRNAGMLRKRIILKPLGFRASQLQACYRNQPSIDFSSIGVASLLKLKAHALDRHRYDSAYFLPLTLSTSWRTSLKHHFPLGFFDPHWQFPKFFSIWIRSIIVDLPCSR